MIPFNKISEILSAAKSDRLTKKSSPVEFEDFYSTTDDVYDLCVKHNVIYDNVLNRVNSIVDPKMNVYTSHVKYIQDTLFAPALGMLTVECQSDGSLVLVDFHHRKKVIISVLSEIPPNHPLRKHPILIRVMRNGLGNKMNAKLNTQRAHTTRNKLLNTNFAFGKILVNTLEQRSYEYEFKDGFIQPIANAIVALEEGQDRLNYLQLHGLKRKVTELMKHDRSKPILKGFDKVAQQKIVRATNVVLFILSDLKAKFESTNAMNDDLESLLRSSQFFGFLLCDALFNGVVVNNYNDKMVENIRRRGSELSKASGKLAQYFLDYAPVIYSGLGISDFQRVKKPKRIETSLPDPRFSH